MRLNLAPAAGGRFCRVASLLLVILPSDLSGLHVRDSNACISTCATIPVRRQIGKAENTGAPLLSVSLAFMMEQEEQDLIP